MSPTEPPFLRSELTLLAPIIHGAPDYSELDRLGIDPQGLLDFSITINPFGPTPAARQVISTVPLDRYPDRKNVMLRNALSAQLSIPASKIAIGNGSAELNFFLAFICLRPGDNVLLIGPTFGEYRRFSRMMGANVHTWAASAEKDFSLNSQEIAHKLESASFRVVLICNPNNPTGQLLDPMVILDWAKKHPQILFVVDESYLAFSRDSASVIDSGLVNVVTLRSLTTVYGLAALRLGYAVGEECVVNTIVNVRTPWSVSAMAQAVGLAVIQDEAFLRDSLAKLEVEKTKLVDGLRTLGYPSIPSHANFFIVNVGGGAVFRQRLLQRGILVRDCASFGLPEFVRIAPRCPEDNLRLLKEIQNL
jgi:histidinol-phosphate aminotransferase